MSLPAPPNGSSLSARLIVTPPVVAVNELLNIPVAAAEPEPSVMDFVKL